jgi:hypothetical protein
MSLNFKIEKKQTRYWVVSECKHKINYINQSIYSHVITHTHTHTHDTKMTNDTNNKAVKFPSSGQQKGSKWKTKNELIKPMNKTKLYTTSTKANPALCEKVCQFTWWRSMVSSQIHCTMYLGSLPPIKTARHQITEKLLSMAKNDKQTRLTYIQLHSSVQNEDTGKFFPYLIVWF